MKLGTHAVRGTGWRDIARRRVPVGIALLVALAAPVAHAEPKDDARRHFQAGLVAAQARRYQEALDEFLMAQAAWPHPATLYNIGRSYADLGQLPEALEYYRLYRSAAPDKADDVDPVIAVLEARLRQPVASSVVPTPAPAPPDPLPIAGAPGSAVARLDAIAAELAALRAEMSGVPAVAVADPVPTPTPLPDAPIPSTEPVVAPALLSDAYERVVITASRYGQAPLDSPSTITVLTDQDIRLSGATTIPDVLRRVAGIDVMSLTAGQSDISVRGFNRELSNKVLVLVDGRSVYLDFLGTPLWESLSISLAEIDRIEIIRGPGSAIYGANAMNGVINILTRTPGEGRSLVQVSGGSPGFAQGTLLTDGRKGPTSWRASAGWHQTGRWSANPAVPEGGALDPILDNQDQALAIARANARVDRAFLDKGLASISGGYSAGTLEFVTLGALGDYGMDFQSGHARGDLAYGPLHLRTFYNAMGGPTGPWAEYIGGRSLRTTFDVDTFDVELEALGDVATGPVAHRLNAGVGYRFKSIAFGYLEGGGEPITENHFSAFVQEEAKAGPAAVVAAFRVDRHPLVPIAQTLSPRGAAILRVAPTTSVRVSGGTAFRAPTFLESYLALDQPTDADGVYVHTVGDKDLVPERILTGEIGAHDESSAFHTADVAAYINRVTNLIGLSDVQPEVNFYDPDANGFSAGTTGFTNLDPVYTAGGVELDARIFPVDGLDIYANLAIERVLEADAGVSVPDGSTSLVKLNGGVMYRTPFRTDVAAHVSYVSAQTWRLREFDETGALIVTEEPIPARTILSARVAVHPFEDDGLELAVHGWNLLALGGNTFREHPKGQLVGAKAWGEVTWRF